MDREGHTARVKRRRRLNIPPRARGQLKPGPPPRNGIDCRKLNHTRCPTGHHTDTSPAPSLSLPRHLLLGPRPFPAIQLLLLPNTRVTAPEWTEPLSRPLPAPLGFLLSRQDSDSLDSTRPATAIFCRAATSNPYSHTRVAIGEESAKTPNTLPPSNNTRNRYRSKTSPCQLTPSTGVHRPCCGIHPRFPAGC